jgi:hypothetical protein
MTSKRTPANILKKYSHFVESQPRWRAAVLTPVELISVVILLVIIAVQMNAIISTGMKGIDTFDMSITADAGWRIYNGQIPYRDFHMPVGPVTAYMQAFFFIVTGGFSWSAIALHAAAVGAMSIVLVYLVVRVYANSILALLAALVTAYSFYLPVSYPWPDQSAFFMSLIGIAALLLAHKLDQDNKWRLGLAAVAGLAVFAALLSKPNIGATVAVLLSVSWLTVAALRARSWTDWRSLYEPAIFAGTAVAALLLFWAIFELAGNLSADVLESRQALQRFDAILPIFHLGPKNPSTYHIESWLLAGTLIHVAIGLVLIRQLVLRHLPIIAALITSLTVSYVARKTTGGTPDNAVSLIGLSLGLALALAFALSRDHNLPKLQKYYVRSAVLFLGVISLWTVNSQINATSSRTIWQHYPEITGQLVKFDSLDSMEGVSARPELVNDVQELTSWFEANVPQYRQELSGGGELFIFPTAQWMYGALGIESFKGVHLWYHPGLTFIGKDPDTRTLVNSKPKYVVLAHYYGSHMRPVDRTKINFSVMPELAEFLAANYRTAVDLTGFTVLEFIES